MTRIRIFLLIYLCWNLPLFPQNNVQVCPSCKVKTIKAALQLAIPGGTITVAKGVYDEGELVIKRPVHLQGIGYPVIDGGGKTNVVAIYADGVSIEGFVIRNSGMSYSSDYAGILAEKVKNCRIRDNVIVNAVYAIYLSRSTDCTVTDNLIAGLDQDEVSSGNGIHLWYSGNIHISGNTVMGKRDGLYLEFAENTVAENNVFRGNLRYGMHFMFSHSSSFKNNRFEWNGTGVAVMYSKHINMSDNLFLKSLGGSSYGLLLKDISDSTIVNNELKDNTIGLFMEGSNRNTVTGNRLLGNGWGLKILGNSDDNVIVENKFISNYFDVMTNSRRNSNTFSGNYWDRYKGYDLNRDKIGDIPFHPVNVFSYWLGFYPELIVLLNSPVIRFLEIAEESFPVLTPENLEDKNPKMRVL